MSKSKKFELSEAEYETFKAMLAAKAESEAKALADATAKAEAEAKAKSESEAKAVRKGRIVTVVRGKKLPLGGRYLVAWMGTVPGKDWGMRVGIEAVDEAGEPTNIGTDGKPVREWTAASNVEAVPECSAACDAAVASRVDEAKAREEAMLADLGGEAGIKGKRLRIKRSGVTGTVRWCRGTRVGLSVGSGPLVFEYLGRCEVAA